MFDSRKILKIQSFLIDQEEDYEVKIFGKNFESFYINDNHVPTELIYEMPDNHLIILAKLLPLRTIIRIPNFRNPIEGISERSYHWEYSSKHIRMFSSIEIQARENRKLSSQYLANARLKIEMKDITQDFYEYKVIDPLAKDSPINPLLNDWLINFNNSRFSSLNSKFLVKEKI